MTGNELSGNGVGTSVSADQYASDIAALRGIVENAYKGVEPKPLVIAPGGFFDANWFTEFITKSGKSIDVVTHHIYNLGPGIIVLSPSQITITVLFAFGNGYCLLIIRLRAL